MLTRLLIDGTLLCLAFGIVVMGSLWWNARLWLHDYPKAMQELVPPLNTNEKRIQIVLTVVVLGMMIGIPVFSLRQLGEMSFISTFAHVWILLNLANLFDAVVLDWIILTRHTPNFAILPGTEHLLYLFHDPRMHLINFGKGVVILTVFSLIIAVIASL